MSRFYIYCGFFFLLIYLLIYWLIDVALFCAVDVWYMCAIMCACLYGYACMCVLAKGLYWVSSLMSLQGFVFLFETGSLSAPETPPLGELGCHWTPRGFCLLPLCVGVTCGSPCLVKRITLDLFVYFVHICFAWMYACELDGCLMLKGTREGIRTPRPAVVSPMLGLGTTPKFLVKTASTLNYWVIFLVPCLGSGDLNSHSHAFANWNISLAHCCGFKNFISLQTIIRDYPKHYKTYLSVPQEFMKPGGCRNLTVVQGPPCPVHCVLVLYWCLRHGTRQAY